VLRRLTECLGRDRTKHQVTEITSLGLVQMTRKRIGQGLLEAFSETCDCCKGRGVILHLEPVAEKKSGDVVGARGHVEVDEAPEPAGRRRGRRARGGGGAATAIDDDVDVAAAEIIDEVVGDDDEVEDVEPIDEVVASNATGAVSTDGPVTTSWTPPVTKSWVNLGASPTSETADAGIAPEAGTVPAAGLGSGVQESLLDLSQLSTPEVEALESESDTGNGRRRRVARWRLRP
jgi:ribonuclease E